MAYFSATNTTKGAAEHIAHGLGADLYEIIPADPYTDADLNYNDSNSRTTIEMNNPNARPAISGSVENMEQYDIVFIGYPIWWGEAPRIPIRGPMATARSMHMAAAYWGFVLMSFHSGMHWGMIMGMFRRLLKDKNSLVSLSGCCG